MKIIFSMILMIFMIAIFPTPFSQNKQALPKTNARKTPTTITMKLLCFLPLTILLTLTFLPILTALPYELDSGSLSPVSTSNSYAFGLTRVTVLSGNLFRLEESPTGEFEDRPSLAFQGRDQKVEGVQTKQVRSDEPTPKATTLSE